MEAPTRTQQTRLLWTVVILSVPTFAALLIEVSAMVHPNLWVYLLIPLTLIAPLGFISAIVITVASRHSMGRQFSRAAWIVLVLALLAGVAAIGIVRLT